MSERNKFPTEKAPAEQIPSYTGLGNARVYLEFTSLFPLLHGTIALLVHFYFVLLRYQGMLVESPESYS